MNAERKPSKPHWTVDFFKRRRPAPTIDFDKTFPLFPDSPAVPMNPPSAPFDPDRTIPIGTIIIEPERSR